MASGYQSGVILPEEPGVSRVFPRCGRGKSWSGLQTSELELGEEAGLAAEGSLGDALELFHELAEGGVGEIALGGVADGVALGLVLIGGGEGERRENAPRPPPPPQRGDVQPAEGE